MVRLGIVGAGVMGANHARVATALVGVELSVVIDPDETRGRALAGATGARYHPDLAELVGSVDAAVLAVPTALHEPLGVAILDAGIDLLVEKPIAPSVDAAKSLVVAAQRGERVLAVGHVERFNPAVLELESLLDDVVHIELARIGPYAPRITEDVFLDLMIHDVDLAVAFARSPIAEVRAVTRSVHSSTNDIASAILLFENGITASVTVSRAGQNKLRRVEITQRKTYICADLIRQDVSVHRVDSHEFVSSSGTLFRQSGVIEIPYLEHRGEPLLLELQHFVDCVRRRCAPRVSGEDGLAALELVLRIGDCALRRSDRGVDV